MHSCQLRFSKCVQYNAVLTGICYSDENRGARLSGLNSHKLIISGVSQGSVLEQSLWNIAFSGIFQLNLLTKVKLIYDMISLVFGTNVESSRLDCAYQILRWTISFYYLSSVKFPFLFSERCRNWTNTILKHSGL